jgi:hypothetical protein
MFRPVDRFLAKAKVSVSELNRKAERLVPGIDPLNLHSSGDIH